MVLRSLSAIDALIAAIAGRQHGLITAHQLVDAGLTQPMISRRASRGALHRIHRGVYAVGHAALSREARWTAALMAVGPDAVISHSCAASLWQITRRPTTSIEIMVPRHHHGLTGVTVHATRSLEAEDTSNRLGFPVTTVARTLVDLADELDPYELANLMHEAAFRRRLNLRSLRRTIDHHRTRPGHAAISHALELHTSGSAGTRSDLERRLLDLIAHHGLPTPLVNTRVALARGHSIEVDMLWPQHALIIEVDGAGHFRARTRAADRARDANLHAAGFRVLRLTGPMIEKHPGLVVDAIVDQLTHGRHWIRPELTQRTTPDSA